MFSLALELNYKIELKGTGPAIVTRLRGLPGLKQCQLICQKVKSCIAFSYELDIGQCALKNSREFTCKYNCITSCGLIRLSRISNRVLRIPIGWIKPTVGMWICNSR